MDLSSLENREELRVMRDVARLFIPDSRDPKVRFAVARLIAEGYLSHDPKTNTLTRTKAGAEAHDAAADAIEHEIKRGLPSYVSHEKASTQKIVKRRDRILEVVRNWLEWAGNDMKVLNEIARDLDSLIDNWSAEDRFGTEGQSDPRGDARDGSPTI